jgi:hypothetical protein
MNGSDEHARKFRDAAHRMAISETEKWICPNCYRENQGNRQHCWKCGAHRDGRPMEKAAELSTPHEGRSTTAESKVHTRDPESREVRALMSRYWDAYVVARVTVGVGEGIKAIAIGLAALIVLGALLVAAQASGGGAIVIFLAGVIAAAAVGGQFYLLGLIVMAQGQILKASLDGAVNTSPFLENEHRAKIMSLK